jgi:hypothetical protein
MPVYTISPDLLRNIEKDELVYFTDILFIFTLRSNPYKVSKDRNGDVIDSYEAIKENGETIKTWLDMMSFKPSPFEIIDVDLSNISCEETKFMKICKETKNQNKMILYSQQNLINHECNNSLVFFEKTVITILDRDEAKLELSTIINQGDTYINSQVAKGSSKISKSKN